MFCMKIFRAFLLSLFPLFICLLAVSACQPRYTGKPNPNLSAEDPSDLLEAEEGSWLLVEEDRQATPIQQNLLARGEVEPDKISKKNKHTKSVKDSHAKDENHFRVLKLERQLPGEIATGLYDIEDDAPSSPQMEMFPIQDSISDAVRVLGVRTGEHPGKTRIVLDVAEKTSYSVDVRAAGQMVVIDLPNASWDAGNSEAFAKSGVLESYIVDAKGKMGASMILKTRKPVRVLNKMLLDPVSSGGNYRIVVDISTL